MNKLRPLLPILIVLSLATPVGAAYKMNPFTGKMDYYEASGSLADLDDLPGDTVDDNLIDSVLLDADLATWAGVTSSANGRSLVSAADYAAMKSLLGLVIGTNVQAYDADLTTYAGITPSANIQSLLGSANYATARTNLGLAIGTNVQAYDAILTDIADGTIAENLVNTANPWADNEVSDTITVGASGSVNDAAIPAGITRDAEWDTIAEIESATGANIIISTEINSVAALNILTGATILYSGGALGIPSGGTLTNCTFPTLNQNTTGTSAGLTGTPNIAVGTITAGASGFLVDADGDVTAKSVTTTPVSSPALVLKDLDGVDDDTNYSLGINLTDTGSGTEDADITEQIQIAGTLTTVRAVDADGNYTIGTASMNVVAAGDLTVTGSDITLGTAGVKLTGDGDGAITLLGLGDGYDEDLTINLDDTENTAKLSSSTGVTAIDLSALNLATTGTIRGRTVYGADVTGNASHDTTALHNVVYHVTAAATITLDAAADAGYGATVSYRVRDASEACLIETASGEKINLSGTALATGTGITATGVGKFVTLVATTDTDASGTDGWEVWGNNGFASE